MGLEVVSPFGSLVSVGSHWSGKLKKPDPGRVRIWLGSLMIERPPSILHRGRASREEQRGWVGSRLGDQAAIDRRRDGGVDRIRGGERPDFAASLVDGRRGRLELEIAVRSVNELRIGIHRAEVADPVAVTYRVTSRLAPLFQVEVVLLLSVAGLAPEIDGNLR